MNRILAVCLAAAALSAARAEMEALAPLVAEKMGYKTEETIYDPQNDRFLTREEVVRMGKENPGYPIIAFSPSSTPSGAD